MSHQLLRFTSQYKNEPLLIENNTAEQIFNYLESRNAQEVAVKLAENKTNKLLNSFGAPISSLDNYEGKEQNGVYLINLEGPLTYKPTFWSSLCGGMSYQGLADEVDYATSSPSVKTIVLAVNSGGGEAYSMMETANLIRKKCDDAGINLISYVDGMSASAAYGITATSHQVILNPESEVGSIGVVVRLTNSNKATEKEGYETTYIYAGDNKIPFNQEGEFRTEFIEDIQTKVDGLYGKFVSHVATARNISDESVQATQAAMFEATKAVELGLADNIMEREAFFEYLADLQENGAQMNFPKFEKEEVGMTTEAIKPEAMVELEAKMEQMQEQMKAQADALAAAQAQAEELKAEKEATAMQAEVDKMAGYSFVTDAVKMAEITKSLGKDAEAVYGAFDAAQAEIAETSKQAEQREELEEMTGTVSFDTEEVLQPEQDLKNLVKKAAGIQTK